jgi:hypothetical protein
MTFDSTENKPSVDELISLRQASTTCNLSPNHLRLLVGKGIIWGKKIDTFWVTTPNAVEEYVSQAHKTGPKPKTP